MPPIDRPPMSPQAQAQMGPPGGAGFGPAVGQAQEQVGKNQADIALSTVEKILMAVPGDTFRTYVQRALAILKTGAAMEAQKGPQSQPGGMASPPAAGAGAPPPGPQLPPMPAQMPG